MLDQAYNLLTDEAADTADDLDQTAHAHKQRNFFIHALSLFLSKIADGLIDPKLVLSSVLTSLGAPVYLIGLLVPVREAGALLPQLPLAQVTTNVRHRKWLWVGGSVVQGVCALLMCLTVFSFDGAMAGWLVVCLLAIFAVGRSACSLSYKDVLGKTVAKSARGTVTGFAASASAIGILAFGGVLTLGLFNRELLVPGAIGAAGFLWLVAASSMATLGEGASSGKDKAQGVDWRYLRDDVQLRRFILARGLLISTALAPPFMLAAAGAEDTAKQGGAYGALGLLILASALASFLSSYIWGRLADRSSRLVLIICGAGGAAALGGTALLSLSGLLQVQFVLPAMLFVLMVFYHGVRVGRSTHLVDMVSANKRSAYTALANTIIGILVILGGAMSAFAAIFGADSALIVLAVASGLSCFASFRLENVQSDGRQES